MKKLTVLCAGLAVLVFASGAFADLTPVGDPMEIGSWAQRFVADTGTYDFLAVEWVSPIGSGFESPTMRNFSAGVWTIAENSTMTLANASLPAGQHLGPNVQFDIAFQPASNVPLKFTFYAFNGNTQVDGALATWNDGGWSFVAASAKRPDVTVASTPLPAALLLGFLGFGAAGLKLRKFA